MAWDSSRPVPYRRLLKEWLIYVAVMIAVFALVLRDSTSVQGMAIGLVVSLPLWLGLSWVLAKLGYQRKSFSDLRAARAEAAAARSSSAPTSSTTNAVASRARPAPTKRTGTGPSNRPSRKRR